MCSLIIYIYSFNKNVVGVLFIIDQFPLPSLELLRF